MMMRDDEMMGQRRPNQEALLGALGGQSQPQGLWQRGMAMAGGQDSIAPDRATMLANRQRPLEGLSPELQQFRQRMQTATGALGPSGGFAPGEPVGAPKAQGGDLRSYLMSGMEAYAPELRKITGQDDSARKNAVQAHIRSLLDARPDLAGQVQDVRGEKINVGGQWIDLMQDVANGAGGGAAVPQWLVEQAGGQQAGGGGISSLMGLMQGNPNEAIQSQIGQRMGSAPNFEALLRQLGVSL